MPEFSACIEMIFRDVVFEERIGKAKAAEAVEATIALGRCG